MKRILKVNDKDTTRDIAMAVLLPDRQTNSDIRRFIKEARIASTLEHPNIVPIYDIGLDSSNVPYFTMKYLKGETLDEIIKKIKAGDEEYIKKYDLRLLLTILVRVSNAVSYAHSKGVIHLDLNPSNIHIGKFGEVLLLDWGLAKIMEEVELDDADETANRDIITQDMDLTLDGVAKGTPGYMAPEQASGKNSLKNEQTDVYGLGAMLYYILTKEKPVSGKDQNEILEKTINGEIISPHEKNNKEVISTTLAAVAMKALALHPEDRYNSAWDFIEEINAYLAGHSTMAEKAGIFKKMSLFVLRHKIISIFTIILLLISLSFTGFIVKSKIKQQGVWTKVYNKEFNKSTNSLNGLQFKDYFFSNTKKWEISEKGLKMKAFEWLYFRNLKLKNDIKVIIKLEYRNTPGALEVCINSDESKFLNSKWNTPVGYSFQFAGYTGRKNTISKSKIINENDILNLQNRRIEKNKEYTVTFEHLNDTLTLIEEGYPALSVVDIIPPKGKTSNNLYIRTFVSDVIIKEITIFRRSLPLQASPLIAGKVLFEHKNYTGAIEQYLTIANNYVGKGIAMQAIVEAYKIAITKLTKNNKSKYLKSIKSEINVEYPNFKYQYKILEFDAIEFWKNKEYDKCFALLQQIFEYNKNTKIISQILQYKDKDLTHEISSKLLSWLSKSNNLHNIDISYMNLKDLHSLKGSFITMLNCSKNKLSNLDGIEKIYGLQTLNLNYNNISNIDKLKNKKELKELTLTYNPIKNLSALENLQLESLNISNTNANLNSVVKMNLLELNIANCSEIKSLDKLKEIKTVQDIKISELSKESKEIILALPNIKYISTNSIEKISKEELKFMSFDK